MSSFKGSDTYVVDAKGRVSIPSKMRKNIDPAANLTFVAYAKALNDISGQVIVFFTLVVAAAEVAVGLAIIVAIFRRRQDVTADDVDLLKG